MANIKRERDILHKFLDEFGVEGKVLIDYEVGKEFLEGIPRELLKQYSGLSKILSKKIDAVIIAEKHYIIEVKQRLDMKQLGQLLCYKDLYAEANRINPDFIKCIAVCEHSDPMIEGCFRKRDIDIYICKP